MISTINKVYNAGIYIRLSKEDILKNNESISVTNQKNILIKYVEDNNYNLYDIYIDDGFTGTNYDRPAFKRMISDIENKKINMVITKDLSRLGRDYIKTGELIEKYFPLNNVRYVSLLDNIDTSINDSNNDIAPFKAVINDMYSKDNSKKIRTAFHTMQMKGKWVGGCVPFGYMKDPLDKNHLIINEKEAQTVKKIFSLAKDGNSCYNIASYLTNNKIPTFSMIRNISKSNNMSKKGIWSVKTIKSILKNKVYIGYTIQNKNNRISYKIRKNIKTDEERWIIVKDTHDAIIDKETFFYVQNNLDKNNLRCNKKIYRLFDGILHCKDCGGKISILKPNNNNKTYLVCNNYRMHSKQNVCTSHSFNYDEIEKLILRQLSMIFISNLNKEKLIENTKKYLVKYDKKEKLKEQYLMIKEDIKNKERQLTESYLDKLNFKITEDIYTNVSNLLHDEIKKLNEKERKYFNMLEEKFKKNDIDKLSINIVNDFLVLKNIDRNKILRLVNKIEIDKNKNIYVYYCFSK